MPMLENDITQPKSPFSMPQSAAMEVTHMESVVLSYPSTNMRSALTINIIHAKPDIPFCPSRASLTSSVLSFSILFLRKIAEC